MTVCAIVACDTEHGIGKNGGLPWPYNKEDMQWFKEHTTGGVVVMGRKTWESIGSKPLPNRINLVISNSVVQGNPDGVYYGEVQRLLQVIQSDYPDKTIWVIGGGGIYRQAIQVCDMLYLTKFKQSYDCDTFIDPEQLKPFIRLVDSKNSDVCSFSIWSRT